MASHGRLTASLNDVLVTSTDYAQERLINLLEGKFKVKFQPNRFLFVQVAVTGSAA